MKDEKTHSRKDGDVWRQKNWYREEEEEEIKGFGERSEKQMKDERGGRNPSEALCI